MSFIAELKNAEYDVVQGKWDRFLVDSWCDTPHYNVGQKCFMFKEMFNVSPEKFNCLKRTPTKEWHYRESVSRFISAHLPRISNYLFDHPKIVSDPILRDEAAYLIGGSKIDTQEQEADSAKRTKERREIAVSKKEDRGHRTAVGIVRAHKNASQRGAWSTCK